MIFEGDCDAPSNSTCDDDTCGTQSTASISTTTGEDYWIVVDGYSSGNEGSFELNISTGSGGGGSCAFTEDADLTGNSYYSDDTIGGSDNLDAPCGTSGVSERLYKYDASDDGLLIVDTNGVTLFDSTVTIFEGDCQSPTNTQCDDNTFGDRSMAGIRTTSGETYWILVEGYNSSDEGPFELSLDFTSDYDLYGPGNTSLCSLPFTDVTAHNIESDDTTGGTDNLDPSCAGTGDSDLIYRYTAPDDGELYVDTLNTSPEWDTVLYISENDCEAPVAEECNDDDTGSLSYTTMSVTAGEDYWIVVDGAGNGDEGAFELNMNFESYNSDPPCNVDSDISGQTHVSDDTSINGYSMQTGSCAFNGDANEIIYEWYAPADGTLRAHTCDTTVPWDTLLHVREGDCQHSFNEWCNDDGCGSLSDVSFPVSNGEVYYIIVDGSDTGDEGDFDLKLEFTSTGPSGNNATGNTEASVNNQAPVIDSILITETSGSTTPVNPVSIPANSNKDIYVRGTYHDDNGCSEVENSITGISGVFYRNLVTNGSACTADDNNCYQIVDGDCITSGCTGGADLDGEFECLVTLEYYTEATDASSHFPTNTWLGQITITDDNEIATDTASTEVASVIALDVGAVIDYGAVNLGEVSSEQTFTITNIGNVSINVDARGTDMSCTVGTIPITNQKYSTISSFDYSTQGDAMQSIQIRL